MTFLDRRDLMTGATALFGASLVAPLARAAETKAAEVVPGMGASHAFFTSDQRQPGCRHRRTHRSHHRHAGRHRRRRSRLHGNDAG